MARRFDNEYRMRHDKAIAICKRLTDTTILDSEKDDAIRTIMSNVSPIWKISRQDMYSMLEFIYEHYMKEDKQK